MAVTNWVRGSLALSSVFNNPENIQAGNNGVATSTASPPTGESIFLQGFNFQVPTASIINGIEVRTLASRNPDTGTITVGLSASLQGTDASEHFATSTFIVSNNADNPTVYVVGGENQFAGDQMHFLNYKNINALRLEWQTLVNDFPDERQLALTGSDSGDLFPAVRIHYTPLRWARVLTSGSNFPVTTLVNSSDFNVVPPNTGYYPTTFTNNQGHLKVTGSIAFQNTPSQPIFHVGRATINSHSLFVSSSTISASNIPDEISIPDTGDFRSDVLWHKVKNGPLPKGRIAKNPTIAVENVLTYTGSMNALNNATLLSGSTPAPFVPFEGNRTVDGFSLPGDVIGFTGVNSGDVGYADYGSQNNLIRIERTSPKRGEDDDLQFFVTASFAIPYSSSFTTNNGLKAYVVRVQRDQDDRFIAEAGDLEIGGLPGEGGPIGMFTGSVVIPSSRTDLLIENERIELRIQNQNASRPVQVGFTGSGVATFELKDEFNANLKPSFYFDVSLESTFVGEAWSTYSGSLSGVSLNNIPPAQGITRGSGLLFTTSSATNISDPVTRWYGQKEATASIRLSPANTKGNMLGGENTSGLTFSLFTDPTNQASPTAIINGAANLHNLASGFPALALTASIADGDGLFFPNLGADQINIINLDVVGSNSGLSLGASGLKISGDFNGKSIENTGGVLNIVTASQGGLEFAFDPLQSLIGLALTSSLAGTGLNFNNILIDRSAINVDYTHVITGSAALTASVPSSGGTLPAGPLYVGNSIPSSTQATVSIQYLSSTNLNILTYQYVYEFHNSLSSISGNTLRINGDVTLGTEIDIINDDVHLHSTNILLSSSFPSLNNTTNFNAPPQSKKRGGLIISNNTRTTHNTGSAIFFDKGVQGNPFTNWDFQELTSLGWMLTTASSVIKQGENTNPFSPSDVNSNPTSSFEHNDFVAHIQTVKTNDIENPNESRSETSRIRPTVAEAPISGVSGEDNLTDGNNGGCNITATQTFVTCSGFTFNIPNDAFIKGIKIFNYAKISSGESNVFVKARMSTSDSFNNALIFPIGSEVYVSVNVGGDNDLLGLDITPSNVDDLQIAIGAGSINSQTLSILGFDTFPLEAPSVIVYYNTADQERELFYATSSMSNYGAIYVNTGSISNGDSNVWMYIPESTT